ncbi:MAG: energy-coupled thiamine transporter ThiT [Candidatus Riflebacteria bacterium]|nr:energy-coupled thiamine transporter ThiT [Candidatus Riflebacteria bacterium]
MTALAASERLQTAVEAGMMVAVGLALSQIKFFQLPSGGSVSLGGLPVMIFAARRGLKVGAATGLLMGLLSLARQPFIVHPIQFLLDYPLAYAALGLAGILEWQRPRHAVAGVVLASSACCICHVVAGIFFFAKPADPWQAAIMASLVYNLAYTIPETFLCAGVAFALTRRYPELTRPCL